jgi:hypothetical protein
MALVLKDRVKETSTTTGTGTFTLLGAAAGFQSFSVIGDGNTTYYTIDGGTEWEVGIGTYTSSGTTLSRDTILESSNGGTAVNFSAGTKNVFVTYPAEKSVDIDTSQTLANKTFTSSIPINGSTSGSVTLQAPAVAGSTVLTLPNTSGRVDAFPSGTAMLFAQTSAPVGWTKSTTHNNKALRVVSGTASSGGTVEFTTAFASQSVSGTVGDTTLTTAQIPSHTHPVTVNQQSSTDNHRVSGFSARSSASDGSFTPSTNAAGGGGSHNHSFSGTAINLAVQYVDVIIATKD